MATRILSRSKPKIQQLKSKLLTNGSLIPISHIMPEGTTTQLQLWKSSSTSVLNDFSSKIFNENQHQSNLNAQCDNNKINVAGEYRKIFKRSSSSYNNNNILNSNLNKNFSNTGNNIITCNMSTCPASDPKYNIKIENINPNFISMEYAVRGPLVIRAGEIEKELKAGVKKPFNQVIRANIGDAHAMGQQPVTFFRQVLALVAKPDLLNSPDFPADAKSRAQDILAASQGNSFGAYTDSYGIELIRRQVADFIERRDKIKSDWQNIILTAGATAGIKGLLSLLNCEIDCKRPGIMIPIPQYPLYSATIAEYGMQQVNYYLDEENNWGLDINELQRALDEGRKTTCVRALCIINPGNPTGQVLTRKNIEEIIKFAHANHLMLFADEVYQENIYDKNSKFYSFKSVMFEMGAPYNEMELASFMSASKGYVGECGIRGGYMELINICPVVRSMLLKSISASLCPTTAGQVIVSCLANHPREGEPSYKQFIHEKKEIINSLNERADLIYKTFNSFEGFRCNPVQGAMYAFPQITIPPKAIEAAKKAGKPADVFYASELLESSGICIVPGSGFGQRPGTYHFRTTILPQKDKLKIMLEKFRDFHATFMQKYK